MLADARWDDRQNGIEKFIRDLLPGIMLDDGTQQPGATDFRVSVHAKDADKFFVFIGKINPVRRWDDSFCQRGTHICLTDSEVSDVLSGIVVHTSNERDEFIHTVWSTGDDIDFIHFVLETPSSL